MKRRAMGGSQITAMIAVGALIVGGAVWGLTRGGDQPNPNPHNLPEDLTVAGLKAKAKDGPGKMFETMRGARENEELTDQQRDAVRRNMRNVMRDEMRQRVDEYFDAPEDQKEAILDKHIDEFQKMREEWEQRRRERERERKANGENEEDERQRGDRNRRGRNQTTAERKARSENRNPDEMARMMSYFSAMRKRAESRGIEMPGRGGPGPRGGGGRRGG